MARVRHFARARVSYWLLFSRRRTSYLLQLVFAITANGLRLQPGREAGQSHRAQFPPARLIQLGVRDPWCVSLLLDWFNAAKNKWGPPFPQMECLAPSRARQAQRCGAATDRLDQAVKLRLAEARRGVGNDGPARGQARTGPEARSPCAGEQGKRVSAHSIRTRRQDYPCDLGPSWIRAARSSKRCTGLAAEPSAPLSNLPVVHFGRCRRLPNLR